MSDLQWTDVGISARPMLRAFAAGITVQITSESDADDNWYAVAGGEIFTCSRIKTSDVTSAKVHVLEIAARSLEKQAAELRTLASSLKQETAT